MDTMSTIAAFICLLTFFNLTMGMKVPIRTKHFVETSTFNTSTSPSDSSALINSVLSPVNQFRQRKGLRAFKWSDTVYQNSVRAGTINVQRSPNGSQMIHNLFQGSNAQVIVPGIDESAVCTRNMGGHTPFELSLLGWLCEVPNDPAIGQNCNHAGAISRIIVGGPDTGHHAIFSDGRYRTIGCSFTRWPQGKGTCATWTGFWFCDFGL